MKILIPLPRSKIDPYGNLTYDWLGDRVREKSEMPTTRAASDSRLNFRLPEELKQIVERAAGHLGQTVSEFAVSTLVRTAHQVIEQHDHTRLSNRDRDIFLAVLEDADAVPNRALRKAAKRYKNTFGE